MDVASWKGMQACSNEEALRYLVWSMPKAFWEIFGLRLAGEDCIKLSPFHEERQTYRERGNTFRPQSCICCWLLDRSRYDGCHD